MFSTLVLSRIFDRQHACARVCDQITSFPPFAPELLLKILGYLPQNDLRSASHSSREFYRLALAAGLYIPLTMGWTPADDFGASFDKLDCIVDYAENQRPDLNIAVRAWFGISVDGTAATMPAVARFFASVDRALPYLVRLDVTLPDYVPAAVYALLCAHPAPRLRALTIVQHSDARDSPSIPLNLFTRDAPRLRALSLSLATTEALHAWAEVAALQRITHLRVSACDTPRRVALACLFPWLRSLALGMIGTLDERTIDISGLALDYLALSYNTGCLTNPGALAAIPVVEHGGEMCATVWPSDGVQLGALCAHAEEVCAGSAALSLGPADGGTAWRRTLALAERDSALPLAAVPGVTSHLVSITLGKSLVNAFILAPVELRALRELYLDVSAPYEYCWPPMGAEYLGLRAHFDKLTPAVRCPALARVVMFAIPSRYPVTVRPTKVTRLGRALRLGAPGPMPTLTLAGCEFSDPPIWTAVNKLFSGVRAVAFSNDHVPGYYRTCRYSGFFDDPRW